MAPPRAREVEGFDRTVESRFGIGTRSDRTVERFGRTVEGFDHAVAGRNRMAGCSDRVGRGCH